MSDQQPYVVVRLDEIERIGNWIPVGEATGIEPIGVNAYVARDDGTIIPDHDETGSGQEELYVVVDGEATFEADGREIAAPAGTLVFARPEARRTARGNATILAIGAKPGEAHRALRWGKAWPFQKESFAAYREGRHDDAFAAVRRGLDEVPDHHGLLYNYACFAVLTGDTSDEVFDRLRRACELFPRFREQAREDPDFESVRDDPRFEAALR